MHRISMGLTMFVLTAAVSCALLPRGSAPASIEVAARKPDFTSSGIDPMPVGTARQVDRAKRMRPSPKA